jgi:hypothetical protein
MDKRTSWLIIQFKFLVSIFSCETGIAPSVLINYDDRVLIRHTGRSHDGFVQFNFWNNSEFTLFYRGYGKCLPRYDKPWRVGLYTYLTDESMGEYSWSKAQY